jgi:hypothetical protein
MLATANSNSRYTALKKGVHVKTDCATFYYYVATTDATATAATTVIAAAVATVLCASKSANDSHLLLLLSATKATPTTYEHGGLQSVRHSTAICTES